MLVNSFKRAYVGWRVLELNRFLASTRHAHSVQRDLLFSKLRRHAQSQFGIEHGFSSIQSLDDFRHRIPISDYEYYRPYIERVREGKISAMFGSGTKLLMFALTSGTTDKSKFIPVTQESFDEYRHGWNLWGVGTYRDHPDLVSKKTLKLGSNWRQSTSTGGTPCGAISGLVAETAPWIARSRFVLPSDVYKIDESHWKHCVALRLAVANPHVGMIGTANPSTLIEFAKLMNTRRESLLRDIHDGGFSDEEYIPEDLRLALRPYWRQRSRARAKELERIIRKNDVLLPRDVWPELSVLAVWQGGSVSVYIPKLEEYYGTPALRDHGLNASEGRMTIPLQDGTSEGLIEFNHHFFEFIPVEEIDSKNPTVLEAHEIAEGRDYYILLTTSAGLYRYNIRDIVRCTGFLGQAPKLIFLNKGANFSSITGEKLSEFQVVTAITQVQELTQIDLGDFCMAPQMEDRPNYVLLTEATLNPAEIESISRALDDMLGRLNVEYADKRRSGRVLPLAVRQIPKGTWSALRRIKSSDRGNFEEYKHRCLVGDLDFIKRITSATLTLPKVE